jgi:hypothetical protein
VPSSRGPTPVAIHATGVGLRRSDGTWRVEDVALKVFVFDSDSLSAVRELVPGDYHGLNVEVERLPVQMVRRTAGPAPGGWQAEPSQQGVPPQRQRHRPIPGGVSISPLRVAYVGTLGCYLRRPRLDAHETLVLSNNHVLADIDRLPPGTPIVQPGAEVPPFVTNPDDVFSVLRSAIPIRFPEDPNSPVVNRFDAAIAAVTDEGHIQTGVLLNVPRYDPARVVAAYPGMRVVKSGRTTGVTRGIVTDVAVDGVEVNYGTPNAPRIAVFDGCIEIEGEGGQSFSMPGDSGAVVLEEETGHPSALLFAGDGVHTTACDLGSLCRRLGAWPL